MLVYKLELWNQPTRSVFDVQLSKLCTGDWICFAVGRQFIDEILHQESRSELELDRKYSTLKLWRAFVQYSTNQVHIIIILRCYQIQSVFGVWWTFRWFRQTLGTILLLIIHIHTYTIDFCLSAVAQSLSPQSVFYSKFQYSQISKLFSHAFNLCVLIGMRTELNQEFLIFLKFLFVKY